MFEVKPCSLCGSELQQRHVDQRTYSFHQFQHLSNNCLMAGQSWTVDDDSDDASVTRFIDKWNKAYNEKLQSTVAMTNAPSGYYYPNSVINVTGAVGCVTTGSFSIGTIGSWTPAITAADVAAARKDTERDILALIENHYADHCKNHNPDEQGDDLVNYGYGNACINIMKLISGRPFV
jgi:hypothetical protein